jgi:hypothetical protein
VTADHAKDGGQARKRSAGRSSDVPEGARLLATQMAVSGSSRTEIEKRLRDDLGVKDCSAILERIGV